MQHSHFTSPAFVRPPSARQASKPASVQAQPPLDDPRAQLRRALGAHCDDPSTLIAMEQALTPDAGCVGEVVDGSLPGEARAGLQFRQALACATVMGCVQALIQPGETLHVRLPAEFAGWQDAREAIGANLAGLSSLASITLEGPGPHDLTPLRAAIGAGVEILYGGPALNVPEPAGIQQAGSRAKGASWFSYARTLVLGYLALSGGAPPAAAAAPTKVRPEPYRDVLKSLASAKYVVLGERHYDPYNQLLNALTVASAGPVAFYREGAALFPVGEMRANEKTCEAAVVKHDRKECARYFAHFVTPSDTPWRPMLERSLASPNVTARRFLLFQEASADDVGRAMREAARVVLSMGHMHATGHLHDGRLVWDDPTGMITDLPSGQAAAVRHEQAAFRLFDRLGKHKSAVLVLGSTVWEGIEDDVRRSGASLTPRRNFHKYFENPKYCVLEVRIASRFNVTVVAPASYESALLEVAGRHAGDISVITPAAGGRRSRRGEL